MNEFHMWLEKHLGYFSKRILKLYQPAPEDAISNAETQLNCALSPQYKDFLRIYNGGRIIEVHINGVQLLGLERIPREMSITDRNIILWSREWWPNSWLELGTDGFGNYYVADLSSKYASEEFPILFVDHEEVGRKGAASFFASEYNGFLQKIIDEMINLYSPDGKLKSG